MIDAGLAERDRLPLAGLPVLLLTAHGRGENLSLPRAACLAKPVLAFDLLEALTALLAGEPVAADLKPAEAESAGCKPAAPERRLRVLLAEDNPVNQALVVCRLEQRGHTVVVTGNGRDTVRAWEEQVFDVVFMDVQMPEMDGLEATALIRSREQGRQRRTPIVALTAHAFQSDRDRCLAAGMDAYLTKPIRFEELFRLLHSLADPAGPHAHEEAVLDRAEMEQRVGGDRELLSRLLELFGQECPRLLGEVRAALAARDFPRLRLAAHCLKGMVATLGGNAAAARADHLEALSLTGDVTQARESYAALEEAVAQLQTALTVVAREVAAPSG